MSCRNSCADLFCIFVVVSVFCTVHSTDFAFSIVWSLSSSGGRDMVVFTVSNYILNSRNIFLEIGQAFAHCCELPQD